MTDVSCADPLLAGDVADYWAGDIEKSTAERIEEHVFTCAECARRLAEGEALARAIVDVVRAGRFQAVVTDAVLNRMAREGVRVRSYVLEPGTTVACAVWPDDEVVVTRLRADLAGLETVDVLMQLESGVEVSRASDVPVSPAQEEIVDAMSAALLRQMPSSRVRVSVMGRVGDAVRLVAEYLLEHTGNDPR